MKGVVVTGFGRVDGFHRVDLAVVEILLDRHAVVGVLDLLLRRAQLSAVQRHVVDRRTELPDRGCKGRLNRIKRTIISVASLPRLLAAKHHNVGQTRIADRLR